MATHESALSSEPCNRKRQYREPKFARRGNRARDNEFVVQFWGDHFYLTQWKPGRPWSVWHHFAGCQCSWADEDRTEQIQCYETTFGSFEIARDYVLGCCRAKAGKAGQVAPLKVRDDGFRWRPWETAIENENRQVLHLLRAMSPSVSENPTQWLETARRQRGVPACEVIPFTGSAKCPISHPLTSWEI